MSTYKPGTVAVATVRGEPNVLVMRVQSNYSNSDWASAKGGGPRLHPAKDVTAVRPLVVLDPEDRGDAKKVVNRIASESRLVMPGTAREWDDGVQAALRSMVAPPKPPEPTGLGAVVEAGNGDRWVRIEAGHDKDGLFLWVCEADEDARPRPWESVNAVRVLSEGVSA